jgi:sugar phosphate isomerase/epimerase
MNPWLGAEDDAYITQKKSLLERYGLKAYALSNHLKGQCVCDDPIDLRHRDMVSDQMWGDGDPEGLRQRAAEELKLTAITAQRLGAELVTGFTGSSIWKYVAMFPPVSPAMIEAGWDDFAARWNPILDVFDAVGVRFAAEIHPGELAFDYWTAKRMLEVVDRTALGILWDPSHMNWQDVDPAVFLADFAGKVYHIHAKDSKKCLDGRNGRLASQLAWGDLRRGWDFVSVGRGDVDWERCMRTVRAINYRGAISVEWEDAGMGRLDGAPEALAFIRSLLWEPPAASFDAAFSSTA